jgi:hypothetical protein
MIQCESKSILKNEKKGMLMKTKHMWKIMFTLVLLVLVATCFAVTAFADDLAWNLLTDVTDDGFRKELRGGWVEGTEEDGTAYVLMEQKAKQNALYIHDDNNILGTYRTFSLEGDFYFYSFPTGLRDGSSTPEQKPLSFLCWIYGNEQRSPTKFNAIRLDSMGYIYTSDNSAGRTNIKLETGTWYNIRCVFTPSNGVCEMYLNDEKVLDYTIAKFDTRLFTSWAVRYFDGYFDWNVKMKNLYVKTDSEYTVELKREPAAEYIGNQTSKPMGGVFSSRVVLGVNSTEYNRIGYETILLTRDDEDVLYDACGVKSKVVYTALKDALGKDYNVKEQYGYDYAAAIVLDDLPVDPVGGYFELVVRPYVLGMDGIRRYGHAITLVYDGSADENGYPIVIKRTESKITVVAEDDTYIYNSKGTTGKNYGTVEQMFVRNCGGENTNLYRAAYYQFTLSAKTVKALETAASAELRLASGGFESAAGRKKYDILVYATATGWDENELTFDNHTTLATTGEKIYQTSFEGGALVVDVLNFLNGEVLNEDGSLTVSFRITNEGHSDAAVSYWYTKESGSLPVIEIYPSLYKRNLDVNKVANKGYEPWGYAEYLVDEWFNETRDNVYPKDENGNLIYFEDGQQQAPSGYAATTPTGDFTYELEWKSGTKWNTSKDNGYVVPKSSWRTDKYARTLSTLGTSTGNSFLESEYAKTVSEYDVYGGIANAGFKGEATGFFHTEKIDGRTYIIDPLGNPFFAAGMNTLALGATTNQMNYSLATFGTEEAYFDYMSESLMDMGINSIFATSDANIIIGVENGLSATPWLKGISAYMNKVGCGTLAEGLYPNNETLLVFDPDFVEFANEKNAEMITENGWADNPRIFGYIADNELPAGVDILGRYLTLDPVENPINAYSYATAWAFLSRALDNPTATFEDLQNSPDCEAINAEFLTFVYSRMYGVIRDSIEQVDKNHMYLGSRAYRNCKTDEAYHRAAGYYLDIITINLYDGLNPTYQTISDIYRNSGKPFIVTEFFAKGVDSIDANGYLLANSTGAGILAATQEGRGAYYEHYVMTLLESKGCVGWVWYRFRDNDQGVYTSGSSSTPLIMLNMNYGVGAKPNTYMNMETGKILTAAEVGTNYRAIYSGEGLASNQNVNKGIYNSDFSSVVMVYTYNKSGELLDSVGYEVEHPETENVADGTVLKSSDGSKTFTVGSKTGSDGTVTVTKLTVYKGKYLDLAKSFKGISDHIIGLVKYFDAN